MRLLFRLTLILVNVMLCAIAGAQTDPAKLGTDPTVEVVTDYQGKILDSDKLDAPYSSDSLTAIEPTFTYQINPLNWSSDFNMKPIPPAGMQIQTGYEESRIGYFRGGLGYPLTPDLNLYLRGKFLDHSSVNIYINHQSFWGKTPMYKDAPQTANPLPSEILGNDSKTRAGVTLQHFWKKVAMDARMEYRHRYIIYHGQDTLLLKQNANTNYIPSMENDKYMRENLSQIIQNVKTAVNFYSITGNRGNNSFNIGGIYEYVRETAHENNNRPVSQNLLGLDLRFNRKSSTGHAFDIRLNTRYSNNYGDNEWSNLVANFIPAYQYNSARSVLTAGVNVEGVHSHNKTGVYIYPQLNLSYNIIDTYLTPYLSAGGGTKLNNYAKITDENPYILPGLNVANTRYAVDLNAGIKGSINTYLAYQVNVGYAVIDSMYFYTNSTQHIFRDNAAPVGQQLLRSNFDVRYDNISKLSLEAGISAKVENFEAILKGGYFQYTMSNEEKPWHLPNIEVGCNLRYTILNKLILNVNGTYRGETPVLLSSSYHVSSTVTPAYVNLNAMVEYRFSERASVYIQGTNLLNDNYQQYYLYYNPGLTFGAGFSVAF